jgi:hypothetical protein
MNLLQLLHPQTAWTQLALQLSRFLLRKWLQWKLVMPVNHHPVQQPMLNPLLRLEAVKTYQTQGQFGSITLGSLAGFGCWCFVVKRKPIRV